LLAPHSVTDCEEDTSSGSARLFSARMPATGLGNRPPALLRSQQGSDLAPAEPAEATLSART